MTNSELSNEFDVLYNNITSNQAPGLNEYEKSVFLTKAQAQLVNEYFNNRTDGFGGGFDGSQKRQYDFSSLIKVDTLQEQTDFSSATSEDIILDKRSKIFFLPSDYFLSVNELLQDDKRQYSVIPINHIEYQKLMLKPYSFPVKKAAWRLITGKMGEVTVVEVIGVFGNNLKYKIRYVKTLSPIILEDLNPYGEDVSIGGLSSKTECQLPEEAHQEILERAVALAKIAWQGTTATNQAAQQRDRE
jgi:hypothetical protein